VDAVECIAVVDLGTNSTRLLVANVEAGRVEELERRTEVTRLGEGVDAAGELSGAAMKRVLAAVASFREDIDEHGAKKVVGVATSAVRDAKNGEEFRQQLADRYGVEVTTISGDEEARLSFLGATSGRPPGGEPLLVLDIGGGSTEFVIGVPGSDPTFHVSTAAGSVRQTERHLTDDPPTDEQLSAVAGEVAAIIEAEVPRSVRREAATGIAVAGTPTQLSSVDLALDPYDSERVHGYRLDRYAVEEILAHLASLPLADRRQVTGLDPARAPTIVGGAIILAEAMSAFDFDWMETSEADILHGVALDAASTTRSSG
jgi:exopolyphosphatase/guanosine-5'-triphosphate,3'-diphosphate pyrophosphatase